MLYVFAEWLGYSPSRYVISTTFPRKQLSEVTQTFLEAGLTGDTGRTYDLPNTGWALYPLELRRTHGEQGHILGRYLARINIIIISIVWGQI